MNDPWLITMDDDGVHEFREFDEESVGIANGLIADHSARGSLLRS